MLYTEDEMLQIAFGDYEGYKSIDEFIVNELSAGYTYYYSIVIEVRTGDFYKVEWRSHGHDEFEQVHMQQVWPERMTTTVWKTFSEIPE